MQESERLEEIFTESLKLRDDEERRKYVQQACGGDVALEQQVFALLSAAEHAASFMESPVWGGRASDQTRPLDSDHQPAGSETEFRFLAVPMAPGDLGSLGPYRILNFVGRGGMAIVFRAFDPKLRRVVAIKVLAPEIAIDPTARQRFEREARSAAAVSHPHIVVIHAVDESHNPPFIVMEYVHGKTLAAKIAAQGALSLKEILRIGSQIADGLASAHKQGLVHRDMKPGNVMLENSVERAKVADFGLAKTIDDGAITRTGDFSGTPQFMSPEQASGGWVDHRSDLFSLGAILYTMCTGKPPFRADNALATMRRVCEDAPRPIQQTNPEIPDWLCATIDRLLEKAPANRIQTAGEVADALQQHLAIIQAGPISPPAREATSHALLKRLRHWTWTALALFAGIGIVVWLGPKLTPRNTADRQGGVSKSPHPIFSNTRPETGENEPVAVDKNRWYEWPADAPPPAIAPFSAVQAKQHQEAWAAYLKVPVEYENRIGMKFMLIPPGEFTMGSTPAEIDEALKLVGDIAFWQECAKSEGPQHQVVLTQPVYLGRHEVTQAQYEQLLGINPSHFSATGLGKEAVAGLDTSNHPVETVSWNDAAEFCAKLSREEQLQPFYFRAGETVTLLSGTGYRLPTEAEWEFACRAGTTTKFWNGDTDEILIEASWFRPNSGARTHAIEELKANPLGLFDVHGNLFEWVEDAWGPAYYGQFAEQPAINPKAPSAGLNRVIRGGCWGGVSAGCRSSDRDAEPATNRVHRIGFRVSLPVEAVKASLAAARASAAKNKSLDPFVGTEAGERRELPDLKIAFRWCPPGSFQMGGPRTEANHSENGVKVPHGFWMQETEVTQAEWARVTGFMPPRDLDKGKGDQYPIYSVSLEEAMKFCRTLNKQERAAGRLPADWECRLPTEAEWEYACRAGTTTDSAFGDQLSSTQANFGGEWPHNGAATGPSHNRAVKVASYPPNGWGIYDMHGNVKEFTTTPGRVRGGSWCDSGRNCCSGVWIPDPPTRSESVGFRVVLVPAERIDPFDGTAAGERREFSDMNIAFRWCPPGQFTMGSPQSEADRPHNEDQVQVTLSHGFWLGETEVTQGQWLYVTGIMHWKDMQFVKDGRRYAVCDITYPAALSFVEKLTSHEREAGRLPNGWRYALPTEAQWEYACRAGTSTRYGFGDNDSALGEYAWYVENAQEVGEAFAHVVGRKKANAWGLKDMHGNVWEWCADWYADQLPGGIDPIGPTTGSERSRRGGAWGAKAANCRSATRGLLAPGTLYHTQGFRIALVRSGQ